MNKSYPSSFFSYKFGLHSARVIFFLLSTISIQLLICLQSTYGQSIEINRTDNAQGLTINKSGTGLDVEDLNGTRMGTAIKNGRAFIQSHSDVPLALYSNDDNNNRVLFSSSVSLGPPVLSPELLNINFGGMRFKGAKGSFAASGIEFTNNAGTASTAFLGMADNGNHLGFWGYGNSNWNVRMSVNNGFFGIKTNPTARLHVNGDFKIMGNVGSPLISHILIANSTGELTSKINEENYTVTPLDFTYLVGTTTLPDNGPFEISYPSGSTGTPVFSSNLNLPHGVKLKYFAVSFVDNQANYNLEACIMRTELNGKNPTSIGCYTSSSASTTRTKANTFSIADITTNNNLYQYSFRLRSLTNSGTLTNWPSNLAFLMSNIYFSY